MEGSPWGRMGQHFESNGDVGNESAKEGLIKIKFQCGKRGEGSTVR